MADATSDARDFTQDSLRLQDPSASFANKISTATTLRDAVDTLTASDMANFAARVLPTLLGLLKTIPPAFTKEDAEHQLRHICLETIRRMPPHEQIRPLVLEIMTLMVHILRTDNEDNGVLAIKITVDMLRIQKTGVEAPGQALMDAVQDMYLGMPALVNETFANGGEAPSQGSSKHALAPAMKSFRVAMECPIATVIFGQHTSQLVGPFIAFLQLQAPPQVLTQAEAAAKGETFIGMSPLIKNKAAYTSFVTAQVKSLTFISYMVRAGGATSEGLRQYQEQLPKICIRILSDIPIEAPGVRREMGVAIRHIVTTDFRNYFYPHLDALMQERLLVGEGVTAHEQLRPYAFSTCADLVHSLRNELTVPQLCRVLRQYICNLHDTTLSPGIQNMCLKVLLGLHEPLAQKLPRPENGVALTELLRSYIAKLHAVHDTFRSLLNMVRAEAKARAKVQQDAKEKEKSNDTPAESTPYVPPELGSIEKQKHIMRASFVVETHEETMKESRLLFRTLLHGIRTIILVMKNVEAPVPDSELLGQFFEGAFHCLALWPNQVETPREEKEVLDWFTAVFHEFQPHVFQEVWTLKMDFFINVAIEHPFALYVSQSLMAQTDLSRQLTSIMLKHLVDRLDLLGDQDGRSANITLRLFKMVFMSVNLLPEMNEAVLAPHLTRLIMDSFPLAAKAKEPQSYYLLIRALFRSISGGKFDRVYNEILPLLQEMLESLNRLITHAQPSTRDLLVELCLTVPVRLTHLLPYLQHLMRPLVLALQASAEMAAQGLRTLELCIDNLTQDFLEPCFAPVRRELMGALYNLLRPLPASHLLAHATIRILGKLGGRNRRLQYDHPVLDYHPCAEEASFLLSFDGRNQTVNLGPMASLASKTIRDNDPTYRKAAFDVLKHSCSVFLHSGAQGREKESVFTAVIEGLFNAIHVADLKEQATQYIRDLSKHIFVSELLNREPAPPSSRRYPMSPVATIFVEWLPKGLAWNDKTERSTAEDVVRLLIDDLANIGKDDLPRTGDHTPRDPSGILQNLASAFVGMCHHEAWRKKVAGCKGIAIMVSTASLPARMTLEREFDFVRALISVLKDMPPDPPRDVDEVTATLTEVIKKADTTPLTDDGHNLHLQRMPFLTGILHMELSSSNAIVRSATQKCIQLISELSRQTPTELLKAHRDRLLMPIYTKPLRALSFATQIGHIDAVTYCLGLQPPLPEPNDELMRLLSEALALADAEDSNLLGRAIHRQNSMALNRLRVACIKLLTASMPVTDFFLRQPPVRQRAIGVYFKSLYSASTDVKNAAHDGLRIVLQHQTRLPKDLLQTGLRPILMNLADSKRISVSGLDGLARLLELLTHYFKVEIGVKLLEHYSSIADPNMLHEAAFSPLATNEDVAKLVKLVNIFHLLPSTANMYLESLSNLVIETETQLHAAAPTPFTEPFGKYVDRYADEAVEYFCRHLHMPRHVQTLRNVLTAGVAPNFRDRLMAKLPELLKQHLPDVKSTPPIPLLLICEDLVKTVPSWLEKDPEVLSLLLGVWRFQIGSIGDSIASQQVVRTHAPTILLSILTLYLNHSLRVDVLFDVLIVCSETVPMELAALTQFLFKHVISVESVALKHEVLDKFLEHFESPSVSWAHKTRIMTVLINPIMLAALARRDVNDGLVDGEILAKIQRLLWQPIVSPGSDPFPGADDVFIVQVLQLSCTLVQFCRETLSDARKDIIRCGWKYLGAEDLFVKQSAHLLLANFFEVFEALPKMVLPVWQGLLRPVKETEKIIEDRHLTRLALGILAPTLPKRIPNDSWMRQMRAVIHEDGHSLSALINIYQLVISQPDVFYDCRDFLAPYMTQSLQKIGLNASSGGGGDTKSLSLDIVDLLLTWEKRQRTKQDSMDTSEDGSSRISAWTSPLSQRENVVSYMLRLVATLPQEPVGAKNSLTQRAMNLLAFLLGPEGWPEVVVKITYFIKIFAALDFGEGGSPHALSNVKALALVLKDKDDAYYVANAAIIQGLLERPLASSNSVIHETLQPVVNRLLAAVPPQEDAVPDSMSAGLYAWVENVVGEGLKNHTNLSGTLSVLQAVVAVQPKKLEFFGAALMKALTKLTKDYTQAQPIEALVPPIQATLDMCKEHLAFLGEHRQLLLKSFVHLVEKSQSNQLCRYLMGVVREWTLGKKDAMYPTMKEKATILQRMGGFMRDDGLWHDFLVFIFDIYTDPALRRSELTIRLENMFLIGCKAKDPILRMRFVDLFDDSLPKSLSGRLQYVLGSSSWETLSDQYWIPQALDLILGSVQSTLPLLASYNPQPSTPFAHNITESRVESLLRPIRILLHSDAQATHEFWISVFKGVWATLSRKEQQDVTRSTIALLSKDYHFRQVDTKVNIVQSFLAGINACSPPMNLPPYLIKYLGKTFNAWHIALEILQSSLESYREEETSRDGTYDALAELYAELSEDDMFYGLWRRRSLFTDTNVAISFEQAGMYSIAQAQYELAQLKARGGNAPFNEAEYCVWEDHWVLASQKLQQWDILMDLARAEENHDLLLECAWRTVDWNADREMIDRSLAQVKEVTTPRRRVFEAYTALVRSHLAGAGDRTEFLRTVDDAMQLALRKWASLPAIVSMAHIPLLQHFQQTVELHEASAIFTALQVTTAPTLEKRSAELKGVLQAWRERLPNLWDDITIWSDLIAWRQHVFTMINNTYLPLIPAPPSNTNAQAAAAANNNTFGYRGYHETAWIINRFAHVARKHQLAEVCHTSLAKIYTLPNIEISEAFLKLREQARCHYSNPNELHAGLEVINNTNLMYFTNTQKAEFYTLKGMFIHKLGHNEEANTAFGLAVRTDLNLPKAWAEWGRYNDKLFKDTPTDISLAANAVSCYLQAAGAYKSAKSRPIINRILWLLANDDQMATVARAFDVYKGDTALWYWITVVPQLLQSLSYRETPHARNMLINLAKNYPQSLFFHLRTMREELAPQRRKHAQTLQAQQEAAKANEANGGADGAAAGGQGVANGGLPETGPNSQRARFPWEMVEEIVAILKTAFPLLALTMETMVDQFAQRFKATQEEELVRYFNALLMEALQCHSLSVTSQHDEHPPLPPQCLENVTRFADSALHPETRAVFKADVIEPKPHLREYIRKLQGWRDKYERVLEARPRLQPLDVLSHWLVEFQHSKFDEVEVPGQYLEHKDSNSNFVRIARFASQYELCLGLGFSYRRITILGHDGTKHSFTVQLPTSRNCRREEKLHQLFRNFNSVLVRRKETRKRVLSFYLPAAVPLNPTLRLLENDSSIVGLQDIYDQHLREMQLNKEDPVILHAEKFRSLLDLHNKGNPNKQEYMNLRLELFDIVSAKMVPNTILSSYLSRSMADANALWVLRKQFTTQMAAITFMSYVMNCITRTPSRYNISRTTGQVYMSDFVPGYRAQVYPPRLGTNEAVPFRFTPNMQQFIGPIAVEGLLAGGIMAIGRTLTEPEYDLEQQLGLFIREEVIVWHAMNNRPMPAEPQIKQATAAVVDDIVGKAELMSCRMEREGAINCPAGQSYPTNAVQSVVTLISNASNPQLLSRMAEQWLPWL